VLKKDSPSSGLFRVKAYGEHGMAAQIGSGLLARALRDRFPLFPLEEEGRLNDLPPRKNLIERIGVYPEPAEGPTAAGPKCCGATPRLAAWCAFTPPTS
jgi:hypothetical protein